MINSFKNPAIMRILRTTERHGAGWREQNFIPDHEAAGFRQEARNGRGQAGRGRARSARSGGEDRFFQCGDRAAVQGFRGF